MNDSVPKVLVTGCGFIGSHVVDVLRRDGVQVTVLDRQGRVPSVAGVDGDINVVLGDIRDRDLIMETVSEHDGVINVAGILGTSEALDNPYPAVGTNILGALNVLEACRPTSRRPNGVRGVQIGVGNHFMNNTYAITKSTAERFTLMYNAEHETQVAVVRALNAYGERQQHAPVRKMIPNFVVAALRGDPIRVYGDGEQIMDVIYVGDVAEVLVRALLRDHAIYRSVIEAGTGIETTVNQLAEAVNGCVGNTAGVVHLPMRRGEPAGSIVLGNPDTLAPLGLLPEDLVKLQDGIERTIRWYRDHYPWQADTVSTLQS